MVVRLILCPCLEGREDPENQPNPGYLNDAVWAVGCAPAAPSVALNIPVHLLPLSNVALLCLSQLDLNGCIRLTDVGLGAIGRQCTRLEQLNVSNCNRVTDKGMASIARHCSRLRRLTVSRCVSLTAKSFHLIAKHCTQLQELDASYCDQLTDKVLLQIARRCSHLSKVCAMVLLQLRPRFEAMRGRCAERWQGRFFVAPMNRKQPENQNLIFVT